MDDAAQQAVAIWAVFVIPFSVFGGFLYLRNQLTLEVIAMYWFPALVLTGIGVLPPPWQPLVD